MNKAYFIIALLLVTFSARAEINPSYPVKLELELCPEVALELAQYKVVYRVKGETEIREPEIISNNRSENTATVEIAIPRYFSKLKLEVFAQCFNEFGESPLSNAVEVDNCTALELLDSDGDLLTNAQEDTNCDGFYSPGDYSNPEHIDSDGDGVTDISEYIQQTDPTNRTSTLRPYIVKSAPYDYNADGNSDPLIWRNGRWYISVNGQTLRKDFGRSGDVPFTYLEAGRSEFGIIRRVGGDLLWVFAGNRDAIVFGETVDWVLPGQYESPGHTNPAIARVFYSTWFFSVFNADGTVRNQLWGNLSDLPKPGDYDGDGVTDIAVYRQSDQTLYYLSSRYGGADQIRFGSPIWDPFVQGDYTGDGQEELTFWDPYFGNFLSLTSDSGYTSTSELQLGEFFTHLPLNWQMINGELVYSVIDHLRGVRYYRPGNNPGAPPVAVFWGVQGDAQG